MFKNRNDNRIVVDLESPNGKEDQNLLSIPWPAGNMANGEISAQSTITSMPGGMYIPKSPTESLGNKSLRSRIFRPGANVRKSRKRAVLKNGDCNVVQMKLSQRRLRFLQDIFTTLVDSQWRWTLMIFTCSFVGSWLFFGIIWWLICFTHGDLEPMHLPDQQADSGWKPCVYNIYSYTSAFLFSIETQTTIGYGVRTTTEECPEAIFMVCLQSVWGLIMQAFMVGIVFAKMTRPKQRAQTLLFSKNAVICQRDGTLCLMFRIGDMRKSHIIGANVRAQLIKPKVTKEGESMGHYLTELEVGTDNCASDIFFIWPMVVVHQITPESPFWNMSASDMIQDRFEIVVILEGTVESTGQTTQARSSYLNTEILWGHRFEQIVHYNKDKQHFEINYSRFNSTQQVDTLLCSASELSDFYKYQEEYNQNRRDSAGLKLKKQLPLRFMHRRPSLPPSRRASCVQALDEEPLTINYIDEHEDQENK
ncbi:G protein-activated inward rectifier potassium channel 3-like isoform X2 [Culicoides brevitarsis]|uniref:G protein-activated inward rectifier potassium channel 3-like isoform X2 n=1 Tax=Culicoides brevitarsis TaxID=469753 RepID=UPI00307B7ACC